MSLPRHSIGVCEACHVVITRGGEIVQDRPTMVCSHLRVREYVLAQAVYDMLSDAYHPQLGENPWHPADTFERWLDPCETEGCIFVRDHAGSHRDALNRAPIT